MKEKLTVTEAIADYNAEKNIKRLAESILVQKEKSYDLEKLIINSDSSSDSTVKIAKGIKDARLEVIDSKKRAGFAGAVAFLAKSNNSDALLILNDDIILLDEYFIEKLIQPFIAEKNVGLICGNAQAMKSNSFVSEAVRSGYSAFKQIGESINHGNNVFTADGKSLSLSQKFIKTIEFPKEYNQMANVDSFMYFTCKANDFEYRYTKSSILYFKCPSTIRDFIKWQTRSYKTNNYIIPAKFRSLAKKEYVLPKAKFNYFKFIEFLKNPLGSTLILFLGIYCSFKASADKNTFNKTWDLVQSTKNI